MSRSKPPSPVLRLLGLLLLTLLISGQHLVLGQSDTSWRRDAGAVARSHVIGMINSGAGVRASLLGYQRGLGAPLIAIHNYEGYTIGGFFKRTMVSVAMKPDQHNNWYVVNVDEAGVFQGLPLRSDWRQVGQDGGRANQVRRRG